MAEQVDAVDLGSTAERHGGSSPSVRTNVLNEIIQGCPSHNLDHSGSKGVTLAL